MTLDADTIKVLADIGLGVINLGLWSKLNKVVGSHEKRIRTLEAKRGLRARSRRR